MLGTVMILQCVGMGLWTSPHLQAQQPPQDPVSATTLFETQFTGPSKGSATLSVATIALAPGQASLRLEGRGALLILVESGSVTLLIDRAIDALLATNGDHTDGDKTGGPEALTATNGDNTGGPESMYHLDAGQQVTLPSIGAIQFRNAGDQTASLLLLTLVPEGGPS
jgi:hypothetical protein